jgi:hypothetical protein
MPNKEMNMVKDRDRLRVTTDTKWMQGCQGCFSYPLALCKCKCPSEETVLFSKAVSKYLIYRYFLIYNPPS